MKHANISLFYQLLLILWQSSALPSWMAYGVLPTGDQLTTHQDPHKTDEACEHLIILSSSFDSLAIICFAILDGDFN
jgi:hypothetical protein